MTNPFIIGQTQSQILPFDPCAAVLSQVNSRLLDHGLSAQLPDPSRLVMLGDFGWVSTLRFWDPQRIDWHVEPCSHNLAFMDGHAEFTRIRKGLWTTQRYLVLPFQDLSAALASCQQEVPCP